MNPLVEWMIALLLAASAASGDAPPEPVDPGFGGRPAEATVEHGRTPPEMRPSSTAPITESELHALAAEAGWPDRRLGELAAVACGVGNDRYPTGESGCDADAVGDGGRAFGLMQIRADHWPHLAAEHDLLDPLDNLRAARRAFLEWREMFGGSGWGAWSVTP